MTAAEGPPLEVTTTGAVADDARREVVALTAAAEQADGVGPLDDQVRADLAYGAGPGAQHVLGRRRGTAPIVAYAHVSRDALGANAHLVVHPEHRRRGLGGALLDDLLTRLRSDHEEQTLRVWAHGDTAGAQALASARHFSRVRDLWQMRRDLATALPQASYPADVTVRTFEPGRDDESWVALNAAAFAEHAEQGKLTVGDLRHRMAEPWFDPRGFFLAERAGTLLGSHWTKVHPGRGGSEDLGEVYAVGVHPSAQGLGLGKALTLTGLHHLRDRGLRTVMLYVDGDNGGAVALYRRLGFAATAIDVMYAGPA